MIRDGQVRKLRCLLDAGDSLAFASRKTGMDEKSARKYRDSNELPSQREMPPRAWRERVWTPLRTCGPRYRLAWRPSRSSGPSPSLDGSRRFTRGGSRKLSDVPSSVGCAPGERPTVPDKKSCTADPSSSLDAIVLGTEFGIRRPQPEANQRSQASESPVASRSVGCGDDRLCGTGYSGSKHNPVHYSWSSLSCARP